MNLQNFGGAENLELREIIRRHIAERGPIPFSEFIQLALYHPEHGYYVACDPSLDYQSSPNVHPVFGACLARQIAEFWRLLGQPATFTVFEAAAGNGKLAQDVVAFLAVEEPEFYGCLRYVTQDPYARGASETGTSSDKHLNRDTFAVATELPASEEIEGCILSNELLDALPVERVCQRDGNLFELRTGYEDGQFIDVLQTPSRAILDHFQTLGLELEEGCQAEVNLEAPRWLTRASAALRRGYVLTLDYGFSAASLYASWRRTGTLLTFYRHESGDDPYVHIGRQDITSSVDFSTLISAGEAAGLRTIGETSQAEFLAALGIGEAISRQPLASELEAFYTLRRSVIELTDPSNLGRIRALIQGKNVPADLPVGLSLTSSIAGS